MIRPIRLLLVATLLTSASGCASLRLPFGGEKGDLVRATTANPVMDVMTMWEPGEGRGLDDLPARGFAGQLLFFTYKHPSPAVVAGQVTVYVFDDQGSNDEQSKPLWQHTFLAEEWNSFALQTNLGTAYQLFIPYVRKGQHEAHCSLRIKFEPSDGGPAVYSKMAHVTLSGDSTRRPSSSVTRQRIEPQRLDDSAAVAARALDDQTTPRREPTRLRSTSVSLPGRRSVAADTASRLQQVAHETFLNQQNVSNVQQAAHFEEPADDAPASDTTTPSDRRYRLHR